MPSAVHEEIVTRFSEDGWSTRGFRKSVMRLVREMYPSEFEESARDLGLVAHGDDDDLLDPSYFVGGVGEEARKVYRILGSVVPDLYRVTFRGGHRSLQIGEVSITCGLSHLYDRSIGTKLERYAKLVDWFDYEVGAFDLYFELYDIDKYGNANQVSEDSLWRALYPHGVDFETTRNGGVQ